MRVERKSEHKSKKYQIIGTYHCYPQNGEEYVIVFISEKRDITFKSYVDDDDNIKLLKALFYNKVVTSAIAVPDSWNRPKINLDLTTNAMSFTITIYYYSLSYDVDAKMYDKIDERFDIKLDSVEFPSKDNIRFASSYYINRAFALKKDDYIKFHEELDNGGEITIEDGKLRVNAYSKAISCISCTLRGDAVSPEDYLCSIRVSSLSNFKKYLEDHQ